MTKPALDHGQDRAMIAGVSHSSTHTAPAAAALLGVSARRRVRPLPAEQHRRESWGRKWGPLTGASIRIHLAKHA
jgi:hypothetical protein